GVLIRDTRSLRLHNLAEHPRSVGFPPGHPPMHTFLGVPILLRGVAYGNLYLTEKNGGGDFTDEDEELFWLLASQAAVAVETARRLGASTGLYVPLLARERPIGVLVAHDKTGPDLRFSSADLRLAEQFANRAAIAVDLSRRVARDALRRVVSGQELERRRLARELHDETGQALTSILLGLRAVEEAGSEQDMSAAAANLRDLVVGTLQDVRRLAVELRPKALDDFGLVPAVERLVETFRSSTGIAVQFESQLGERRLPSEVETTLYRVAQEALTNVAKHAGAQT